MMPAGVVDVDLEELWGLHWSNLAKLLIDRDLIRKNELKIGSRHELEAGYDLGQKDNYVYMLLPFIKIESFL